MNAQEIPWLSWFASGLDDLIYREARQHSYFIPWFRAVVNQACDRIQARIDAEDDAQPLPFPLRPRNGGGE